MSREIKFRVWDKASNVYLKNTKEPQDDNLFIEEINRKGSGIYEVTNWGDAIIEQFTGLKDKNGIYIFDGDIIKNATERLCEVKWHESSGSWDAKALNCKGDSFGFQTTLWNKEVEVMGNMHQHSNILELPN